MVGRARAGGRARPIGRRRGDGLGGDRARGRPRSAPTTTRPDARGRRGDGGRGVGGERGGDVGHGGEANGAGLGERAQHHGDARVGDLGGGVDGLGLVAEDGGQHAERPGGAVPGHEAREELVGDDPPGELVGAPVDLVAARVLGRHVGGRPQDVAGAAQRPAVSGGAALEAGDPGDAEVEHLDHPVVADDDVLGLHVAVDDAEPVGVGERDGHVGQPAHPESDLDRGVADVAPRRGAADELHGDEGVLAGAPGVEDLGHPGVMDGRAGPRLAERGGDGLVPVTRGQDLDRHRPLQPGVEGAVDAPHPAPPEEPLDDVALEQRGVLAGRREGIGQRRSRIQIGLVPRGGSRVPRSRAGAQRLAPMRGARRGVEHGAYQAQPPVTSRKISGRARGGCGPEAASLRSRACEVGAPHRGGVAHAWSGWALQKEAAGRRGARRRKHELDRAVLASEPGFASTRRCNLAVNRLPPPGPCRRPWP